jgi:CheY-like chemotaxis protein
MQSVLIVDDNDRYANNLKLYFDKINIPSQRAFNAQEGFEVFLKNDFSAIISDITMESQVSGLLLVRKIYKSGYKGKIIIATTGFDFPGVMAISSFLLPSFGGVGWMIPKVPLKRGEVIFVPTLLKKGVDYSSTLK